MARVSNVQDVFDGMPSHVRAEQIGDTNAVIQFDVSGEGGGQWYATLSNGSLTTTQGQAPSPNVTLNASASDFLALINGELHPMNAFMQGRVKVRGDIGLMMRLQSLFSR